jgi:hypothetical protein
MDGGAAAPHNIRLAIAAPTAQTDGLSNGRCVTQSTRPPNRGKFNKPVVVYVQPKRGFVDVRTQRDLSALLAELDRQAARRLHADAIAEGLGQGLADQPALGL